MAAVMNKCHFMGCNRQPFLNQAFENSSRPFPSSRFPLIEYFSLSGRLADVIFIGVFVVFTFPLPLPPSRQIGIKFIAYIWRYIEE